MNYWRIISTLLALAVLVLAAPGLAQAERVSGTIASLGTGFTYQGYLEDEGVSAEGEYDFEFSLYDVKLNGSPLDTLTLEDQTVTDGYFTVMLDFGAGMFDGGARWLEIGVRPGAETGAYTTLDPRQPLSAAPYAMYAVASPWAGLIDVPQGFADNIDNNTTYTAGSGLTLSGTEFSVDFAGSGTADTVAHSDHTHTNYWSTNGNYQTDPAVNFIGTGDDTALVFRVNNLEALRLEPNDASPNIIGGYLGNSVTAGMYGATIGGGGYSGYLNQVTSSFGTVGGGYANTADSFATVGGGSDNTASGYSASVGGGNGNEASGNQATVCGGLGNTASAGVSTIGGGSGNTASLDYATVGGGHGNNAINYSATVGGGWSNEASGESSTVAGGINNTAAAEHSTVPGGAYSAATHYGEMSYASGFFTDNGDAQASLYVMRNTGTGSSWINLYLDGSSERLTLASGRTITFDILIVGRTEAGESAGYRIQGVIENVGGTTALVGTPTVTTLGENDTAWGAGVLADNTNHALTIQVIGNGETIRWVATVQTAEVAWVP